MGNDAEPEYTKEERDTLAQHLEVGGSESHAVGVGRRGDVVAPLVRVIEPGGVFDIVGQVFIALGMSLGVNAHHESVHAPEIEAILLLRRREAGIQRAKAHQQQIR